MEKMQTLQIIQTQMVEDVQVQAVMSHNSLLDVEASPMQLFNTPVGPTSDMLKQSENTNGDAVLLHSNNDATNSTDLFTLAHAQESIQDLHNSIKKLGAQPTASQQDMTELAHQRTVDDTHTPPRYRNQPQVLTDIVVT